MIKSWSKSLTVVCLWASTLCILGCQSAYLPWVASEWREDEKYTVTTHQQLEELRAIRAAASSMSPDRQLERLTAMQQLFERSDNPSLRQEVIRAAERFSVPQAYDFLDKAIASGDSAIRVAVCEAWAKRGEAQALEKLLKVEGSDSDMDVRLAALRGLGEFQDQRSVRALAGAIEDPNPAVQYRAIQSLQSATGENFGNDVPAWRAYLQERGFATAAR